MIVSFIAPSPAPPDSPSAAHFAAPICRNCGAALERAHCAECGQQRARRLNFTSVGSEAWQNLRLFELDMVKGALRLVAAPGLVAREYVLGARKRHVHPLKLLLVAIGVLLLVLGQSRYLDSASANLSLVMAKLMTYGNWSFSLGLVAIVAASMAVFRRRAPYNLTEHLVLGVYIQFLIIVLAVLMLLPTLIWRAPAFLALHKAWWGPLSSALEILIVVVAFRQFFALEWRADALRLLAAAAVFALTKTLLVRLYAWLLVKAVLAGML